MERQEIPEGEGFFVLTDYAAGQTVTVTDGAEAARRIGALKAGEQFRLEPVPPIPVEDSLLVAVNCVRTPEDSGILLVAILRDPGGGDPTKGYLLSFSSVIDTEENCKVPLTTAQRAAEVVTRMVETHRAPDFDRGWQPVRLDAATPEETRRMKAKEQQRANLGSNKGGSGGKKSW